MDDYSEIENLLGELLSVSTTFSNQEREEVEHFSGVGEYGLALETAVDIYADKHIRAGVHVRQLVARLAEMMHLAVDPLLAKLPD